MDLTGMPMADDNQAPSGSGSFLRRRDILHNEMTSIDSSLTRPRTVTKNYQRRAQNIT
jgi:hypothetical protein